MSSIRRRKTGRIYNKFCGVREVTKAQSKFIILKSLEEFEKPVYMRKSSYKILIDLVEIGVLKKEQIKHFQNVK